MKKVLFLICILFVLGCNQNNTATNQNREFFEFDQVDHYSFFSQNHFVEFMKTLNRDSLGFNIIYNEEPKSITDSIFEQNLTRIGLSKNTISESKYKEISYLFSESDCTDGIETACEPIFRDILVFKKEEKTTGIAKICFECYKAYIIGTEKDTSNFTNCDNLSKLHRILYK